MRSEEVAEAAGDVPFHLCLRTGEEAVLKRLRDAGFRCYVRETELGEEIVVLGKGVSNDGVDVRCRGGQL